MAELNCVTCTNVEQIGRMELRCRATTWRQRRPTKGPAIITVSWGLSAHWTPPTWCPLREPER